MAKQKALTDREGEVRELKDADFSRSVSVSQLPASMRSKVGGRGPQRAATKERISIRLSKDVVESFRASGPGWQGRMDAELTGLVQGFRDRLAAQMTGELEDDALDLKAKIDVIMGLLDNAPYPPSSREAELIAQAEIEADQGHEVEAEMLLQRAILAYRQGRFAA